MYRGFLFVLSVVFLIGCDAIQDQGDDLDVVDDSVSVADPIVELCDEAPIALDVSLRVPYELTYEWFIAQAELIAHMDATLEIYESRVDEMYKGYTRTEDFFLWPMMEQGMFLSHRDFSMFELGTIGVMRNTLVEEYHAASDRFDWTPYTGEPNTPEHEFHLLVIP